VTRHQDTNFPVGILRQLRRIFARNGYNGTNHRQLELEPGDVERLVCTADDHLNSHLAPYDYDSGIYTPKRRRSPETVVDLLAGQSATFASTTDQSQTDDSNMSPSVTRSMSHQHTAQQPGSTDSIPGEVEQGDPNPGQSQQMEATPGQVQQGDPNPGQSQQTGPAG